MPTSSKSAFISSSVAPLGRSATNTVQFSRSLVTHECQGRYLQGHPENVPFQWRRLLFFAFGGQQRWQTNLQVVNSPILAFLLPSAGGDSSAFLLVLPSPLTGTSTSIVVTDVLGTGTSLKGAAEACSSAAISMAWYEAFSASYQMAESTQINNQVVESNSK